MKHCGQKPPIDDLRDSNDDDSPCLRVEGHADGFHLMYDQYAKEFCFWKIDYGCDCPVEVDCESCIDTESISIETMMDWLKDDFNGKIPQEVLGLVEKHKKEMSEP